MKQKLLFLLFALLVPASSWAEWGDVITERFLMYEIVEDDEVWVVDYDEKWLSDDLEIPSLVRGTYVVTGISSSAFAYCTKITSVTIPSTVKFIGNSPDFITFCAIK